MPCRLPLSPLSALALLCVALCAHAAVAADAATPAAPALPLSDTANLGNAPGPEQASADAVASTTADFLDDDDSGTVFAYGDEMLVKMKVSFAHVRADLMRLKRVTVTNLATGQVHVLMENFAATFKGKANRLEHTRENDGTDVTFFTLHALVAGLPAEDPVFLPSHARYVIDSIASVEYSGKERALAGRGGLRGAGRRARDTGRTDVLASTRVTIIPASA